MLLPKLGLVPNDNFLPGILYTYANAFKSFSQFFSRYTQSIFCFGLILNFDREESLNREREYGITREGRYYLTNIKRKKIPGVMK